MQITKVLISTLVLSLGCSLVFTSPAQAIEETNTEAITVTDEEDPSGSDPVTITEDDLTTTEGSTPVEDATGDEDCDQTTDPDCQPAPERVDTEQDLENALDEGLVNEPEVVCADGDESDCEGDSEPEIWPLVLSLSALAVTIVFIIIINLIGRKNRKNRQK